MGLIWGAEQYEKAHCCSKLGRDHVIAGYCSEPPGEGRGLLRAWFGLDNFGEDVLYPWDCRSRVRVLGAAGYPFADFNRQTRGQVWRLVPLGSSCRAGTAPAWHHPYQVVCPHHPGSDAEQAVCGQ